MISAILQTSSIIITWVYILIVVCGVGLLIQKLFGLQNNKTEYLVSSFWMGWAAIIGILQGYHFFFPVNLGAVTIVSFIGFIGFGGLLRNNTFIKKSFSIDKQKVFVLTFMIIFIFWLANQSMAKNYFYDSGLYHLQMIKWNSSYPLIPGLGNLHSRFAYNNSFFLYMALLDYGPWTEMSNHLGCGLLLLVLSIQIALSFSSLLSRTKPIDPCDFLNMILVYPVMYRCMEVAPTTSTDLPVFVLTIVIGNNLLRLLSHKKSFIEIRYLTFFITILSIVGITIKLSFIAFGFFSSLIAIGYFIFYIHKGAKIKISYFREFLFILIPMLLLLIPWMIRGIYLSGYIAYPSTTGSVNVEWKIPHNKALHESNEIRSWARQPKEDPEKVLSDWRWLSPWFKKIRKDKYILPILSISIFCMFITFYGRKYDQDYLKDLLILIPAIASLIFWFFMAPDPRFAKGSFWFLFGVTITSSMNRFKKFNNPKILYSLLFITVAIIIRSFVMTGIEEKIVLNPIPETKEFITD